MVVMVLQVSNTLKIFNSELLDKEGFNLNEGMDIIDVPHTFTPPGGFSDYDWELNEDDD